MLSADFSPSYLSRPGEISITPWSVQSIGAALFTAGQAAPTAGAWPAANLVIFIPFWVPEPFTATKMFFTTGAQAGNVDLGIYNEDQTRAVSIGTTAVSGATNPQVLDIADTTLARGRYYLAMVADTVTTLTVFRSAPAAGIAQSFGLLEQAGITLPLSTGASPATFAKYTRAYVPWCGVQGYRTLGP